MSMVSDILHFLEFMVVIASVLLVLFAVLLVVVSKMPDDNPLKILLSDLSHRIGATAGLMIIDPFITPIPAIGEIVDLGTVIFLIYYWFTFFRQILARRKTGGGPKGPSGPASPPPSYRVTPSQRPTVPALRQPQPYPPEIEHL